MLYAVSDLHGFPIDGFLELLRKAGFSDEDHLFILGDVIDRGEDGIKILKWAMRQHNVSMIKGNHEAMMLSCDFLFDEVTEDSIDSISHEKLMYYSNWISNGASPTLEALRCENGAVRNGILRYIYDAPLFKALEVGGRRFILTHSGFGNFSKEKQLSDYTPHDLYWNRPSLEDRYFDDITTVFGHTPTANYGSEFEGRIITTETWINIDAGAAWGFNPALLRLDDLKEIYL